MGKYIDRITGAIPHTHKTVDIAVGGKNLIITGGNGSGKTSFLLGAYEKTRTLIVEKQQADLPELKKHLIQYENQLAKQTKGTSAYVAWTNQIQNMKNSISAVESGLQISIPDNLDFSAKYDERKAVVQYFEDKRLANIAEAKTAQGLQIEIEESRKTAASKNIGSKLEQHLLNLKTRRSLAITEDHDQALADRIDAWFGDFESSLQELLEDNSARMVFDSNKNKFSIQQAGKPPYTFQTLSAGYKAIFDVYADLLMRTEYFEISPSELEGVVFIDEIDSHLHVSLQRKILPFFVRAFPRIQFIVTTHSPFVLMSSRDTLVYDLSKEEPSVISQVKSQNEILRDYLNVPVAMPVWAEESLNVILEKYTARDPGDISLAALKQELAAAGLEEFFPDSAAKILEAH